MSIKESIYDFIIKKNPHVQYEYEKYVKEHLIQHYEHRFTHWKILIRLLWHYRVCKRSTPLMYWDYIPAQEDIFQGQEDIFQENQILDNKANALTSESHTNIRTYTHHIVKGYMEYDIVSFNVFGTLLFNPFEKPEAMFYLLENILEIDDFYNIRILAEKVARREALALRGSSEVTIHDIYTEVEKIAPLNVEQGVQAEFELAKKLYFANPYMKNILEILNSFGQKMYITADSYFPSDMLEAIMKECGIIYSFEKIVSCDYNCSKKNDGELYKILKRRTKKYSVIHIGDDYNADIKLSYHHGFNTHYYKNINTMGNIYRSHNMSRLVGAAYKGIVNAKLNCGLKRYSHAYEYGYLCGGIYLLGFCNYIADYIEKNQIEKVLFLSNSGHIYKKVFNRMYPEIDSETVLWSKSEESILTMSENRFFFIMQWLDEAISNNIEISISELLVFMKTESLFKYLKEHRLNPEELLSKYNKIRVRELFIAHYDDMIMSYSGYFDAAKEYYEQIVGNAKRVIVVDFSEEENNLKNFVKILMKQFGLCDYVRGVTAIKNHYNNDRMISQNTTLVDSYICENINYISKKKYFKILTYSTEAIFEILDAQHHFHFKASQVENHAITQTISKGMQDFIDDYITKFGEYKIMLNISSYDAYSPFCKLFEKGDHLKQNFSNMIF
jgi:hypothetical protein